MKTMIILYYKMSGDIASPDYQHTECVFCHFHQCRIMSAWVTFCSSLIPKEPVLISTVPITQRKGMTQPSNYRKKSSKPRGVTFWNWTFLLNLIYPWQSSPGSLLFFITSGYSLSLCIFSFYSATFCPKYCPITSVLIVVVVTRHCFSQKARCWEELRKSVCVFVCLFVCESVGQRELLESGHPFYNQMLSALQQQKQTHMYTFPPSVGLNVN